MVVIRLAQLLGALAAALDRLADIIDPPQHLIPSSVTAAVGSDPYRPLPDELAVPAEGVSVERVERVAARARLRGRRG